MTSKKKTQFQKGKTGNPSGKNKSNFGELIRNHPKTPALIQKLFDIALHDGEKHQIRAISILMDRVAPQLKASEIKAEISESKGVIILPQKGRGEVIKTDDKIKA